VHCYDRDGRTPGASRCAWQSFFVVAIESGFRVDAPRAEVSDAFAHPFDMRG